MITIRQLLFFLLTLFVIVSCNKEDIGEDIPEEERIPIRFEIGFEAETRVATDAAFNSTWGEGDAIGIFIVKGDDGLQPSGNYVDNLKLTYSSGTWTQEALPPGKEYYPSDGSSLSFYAYYPYKPDIDPTNALFSIEQDQASEANYNKSELLLAKNLDYRLDPAVIPLNFTHAHALLQIEVVQQGTTAPDNILKLVITDVYFSVNVNLATGPDVIIMQGQDVLMYKVNTTTYRALIPSQSLSGSSKIEFKVNGVMKGIYSGLQSKILTSGKVHKYKLTVTDFGL